MFGIIKDNKHSFRDYGLTIASRSIGIPKKNKIKETVPYMNGSYDFSNIYGEQTYSDRVIEYRFNIVGSNKINMNMLKINVLDWLFSGPKTQLYDDTFPDLYFMAECEEANFDENNIDGQLTAKFVAYPFKLSNKNEGDDIWDTFNFELDMVQDTHFTVNGYSSVKITNLGAVGIVPSVKCSSNFEVIKGNTTYLFGSGVTKDWRFKLDKGINTFIIKGTGTIEFIFRKEVL